MLHRVGNQLRGLLARVVLGYLDGSYCPLAGVGVGLVVQRLVRFEYRFEFGQRLVGERPAQFGILGHRGEGVALEHCLEVEAGPPAEDGCFAPRHYLVVCPMIVADVLKEVVFVAGGADVYQVVGNGFAPHGILRQVFARADIH